MSHLSTLIDRVKRSLEHNKQPDINTIVNLYEYMYYSTECEESEIKEATSLFNIYKKLVKKSKYQMYIDEIEQQKRKMQLAICRHCGKVPNKMIKHQFDLAFYEPSNNTYDCGCVKNDQE